VYELSQFVSVGGDGLCAVRIALRSTLRCKASGAFQRSLLQMTGLKSVPIACNSRLTRAYKLLKRTGRHSRRKAYSQTDPHYIIMKALVDSKTARHIRIPRIAIFGRILRGKIGKLGNAVSGVVYIGTAIGLVTLLTVL
jgi:hypothetical protein